MGPSLVLNASYEPLSVVPGRRASVLILTGKADLMHSTDERLRSERLSVPIPSVVKLRYFVKTPFWRGSALSRRGVFARDGQRCQYCGGHAESIDHVHPRSRGGQHRWENVVAACRRCNAKKRDQLLQETSMRLRSVPCQPPKGSWVTILVPNIPLAWEQYLPPRRQSA
ncbi:MAG: HNH endonuclease [Acidimicrobiales bacterium]